MVAGGARPQTSNAKSLIIQAVRIYPGSIPGRLYFRASTYVLTLQRFWITPYNVIRYDYTAVKSTHDTPGACPLHAVSQLLVNLAMPR